MNEHARDAQDASRISRRNALKGAVAAGVGAVAWTGPQITAFGATPAYAAACTFAEFFSLSRGDRNSDQSSGCTHWRYHEIKVPIAYDSRFTLNPVIPEDPGVCADDIPTYAPGGFNLCYSATENLDCFVRVYLYNQNKQGGEDSKGLVYDQTFSFTPSGASECVNFQLPTGSSVSTLYNSSLRYSVSVSCVTNGDEACFPS